MRIQSGSIFIDKGGFGFLLLDQSANLKTIPFEQNKRRLKKTRSTLHIQYGFIFVDKGCIQINGKLWYMFFEMLAFLSKNQCGHANKYV